MTLDQSRTRVFLAPRDSDVVDAPPALRVITLWCCGLAALAAVCGLAGWILGDRDLEQLVPGPAVMTSNTAVALLALALTAVLPRSAVLACAGLAGVLAGVELLEHGLTRRIGVDALFADHGGTHAARTSAAGALCLLALAVAVVLRTSRGRVQQVRQGLVLASAAVSGTAVLGYLYGADSLYDLGPFSSMALHTAVALILLSLAALTSTEQGALPWAVFADNAGAALIRRLGPVALVGLPLIGLACVGARRVGWLDGVTAVALTVVLSIAAFLAATWRSAVRIARVDEERQATVADLGDLKKTLEQQVISRAELLRSRHDEIAVLEDRQRIAADIHDIVIQRLFAAGMFLQGTSVSDPAVQGRIDAAIESMDIVIKELRASIFELGGHVGRELDLATVLDDVCTDAARVLGFRPELLVDDPDDEAETVRDDISAVLRESLSNVARHAGADAVEVVLRTGNGLISLTVTDNGAGMTRTPHSSGTRNMAERARQRGGDCVWTTVEPHGTRVWWHVPGTPPDLSLALAELDDAQPVENSDETQAATP